MLINLLLSEIYKRSFTVLIVTDDGTVGGECSHHCAIFALLRPRMTNLYRALLHLHQTNLSKCELLYSQHRLRFLEFRLSLGHYQIIIMHHIEVNCFYRFSYRGNGVKSSKQGNFLKGDGCVS